MTTTQTVSCSAIRCAQGPAEPAPVPPRNAPSARPEGHPGCHAVTRLLARLNGRSVARLGSLSLSVLLSACGASAVNRGADLYAGGHYVESAEVFEHTEPRLKALTDDERARYGLYRGATLLGLGDLEGARHWLGYSTRVVSDNPTALPAPERNFLRQALGVVERPAEPKLHTAMVEGRVAAHSTLHVP